MATKVRYVIDPKYNLLSMFDPESGQYWRINNKEKNPTHLERHFLIL